MLSKREPWHEEQLASVTPSAAPVVATEPLEYANARKRPVGSVAAAVADEALQFWNFGGRSDPTYVSNRPGYHPGTRVLIDLSPRLSRKFLSSKSGMALSRRWLAALRNVGYWPMRNCYEDAARIRPELGGKTELLLSVDGTGNVRLARVKRTEHKTRVIPACQAAALRRLRLTPAPQRRVDLDVTVSVWPGDLPLLPLPQPEPKDCGDLSTLSRFLTDLDPDIAHCMVGARQRDPKLWGRLSLAFTLGNDGRPGDIQLLSNFGDEKAVDCAKARLRDLSFPRVTSTRCRLVASWRLERAVTASPVPQGPTGSPSPPSPDTESAAPSAQ